jgi:multiple sugar transport system substrate-binding protein
MKWNNRKSVVVIGTSVGILLTGCGSGGEANAGQADGTGEIKGTIEAAWWGGEARTEKTNAVIGLFEEANPEVSVAGQSADFGPYFDKLNIQASSQSLPCAVQLQGRQLNDYTKRDLLLPLDPMIESGAIDVGSIPGAVLDNARGTDGKLYFLPYGAAYDAVGINTTLADDAGVGLPEEGYTWDQYVDYLTDAQANLPEGVHAVGLNGGRPNFFIGWTLANGKTLFDEDGKLGFSKEDLATYWEMWEQLRTTGVTPTAERSAEQPPGPDQGYFATGDVLSDTVPGNALTPASATLEGQGKGHEMITVPYPAGSSGPGNVLYPSGFAIPKNCDNVATAAAFIDFFTNDVEAGVAFAADNGAPTNTEVLGALLSDSELSDTKRHELELFQEIVENDPPTIIFPPGYQATFEASFNRAYEQVAFGNASVQQAVETFFEEANSSLGQ